MDNYQAISYAQCALKQLQNGDKDINTRTLKEKMIYLMGIHTTSEIEKKAEKIFKLQLNDKDLENSSS